ncbi:MAG: hypothetical protein K9K66_05975 [Desulfarculaceae bacterium]|nr:hypothetical protein [Desulfarculaceae bacterium]MCF8071206.1 hypothetical protein [Desulfarculaceae bacterium]MCF8101191.1 hypothetical protein [Desulfarculaceae bacterium]MCF8115260.1 hypothetical protein [Desulfarculaceae bacterium]
MQTLEELVEFFGLANLRTDEKRLQECLTLERLPEFCAGISSLVKAVSQLEGEVYCLWGHFALRKENINGGVRFTMPTCPNALAWTVTTGFPPDPDKVVVHATIARPEHDPGFIESIEEFVAMWVSGLEASDDLAHGCKTPTPQPLSGLTAL